MHVLNSLWDFEIRGIFSDLTPFPSTGPSPVLYMLWAPKMTDGHSLHCSSLYPCSVCAKTSHNSQAKTQSPKYSGMWVVKYLWSSLGSPYRSSLRYLFCFEQISCQLILFSSKITADLNLPVLPFPVFVL